MVDDARIAKQYQAPSEINLASALSGLNIEYLTVSDERMLVIYTRSILNIDVTNGDLQGANSFEIAVLDHDSNGGTDNPHDLITSLLERVADTTESDLSPVS
ncbi:hypothetical protein [Natrialba sp. SSL1]|uniref:hypothetical protein n=1 Tax=Natrialba sp. SSL1 TaxID=1869245 RepID=UPI0009FF7543|nr:hypothetical protein [Natrialba sp. SSL1]